MKTTALTNFFWTHDFSFEGEKNYFLGTWRIVLIPQNIVLNGMPCMGSLIRNIHITIFRFFDMRLTLKFLIYKAAMTLVGLWFITASAPILVWNEIPNTKIKSSVAWDTNLNPWEWAFLTNRGKPLRWERSRKVSRTVKRRKLLCREDFDAARRTFLGVLKNAGHKRPWQIDETNVIKIKNNSRFTWNK